MPQDRSIEIKVESVGKTACGKCGTVVDVSTAPVFSTVRCPKCGSVLTTPGKFGEYVLLKELGRWQMGVTYKAFEKALGRYVAIKVMAASGRKDPKRVKAFLAEGRALASLDHPNAVRVFSLGQEHRQPYIVMELVGGRSMGQMLGAGKPMGEARVLEIATDVARALRAAGRIGLIHGDIKPDNIVLNEKGRAKLVDFGAARSGGGEVQTDAATGIPYYVAPEQVSGTSADHRADIYSLGATLFHGLAGAPPFPGTEGDDVLRARIEKPAPNLMSVRQGLELHTIQVVARMLERDPDKRYQNYDDLLGDLHKACLAAGVESALEADADRTPPPSSARRLPLGKMLAVAVAMTVVGVAVWAVFFRAGVSPAPVAPVIPPAAKPAQTTVKKVARPMFPSRRRTAGGNIDVVISCRTRGAEIYYTIDGSKPTRKSARWQGGLRVNPGVTLSARAFLDGWKPSEITRTVIGRGEVLQAAVGEMRRRANAAWQEVKRLDSNPHIKARLDRCAQLLRNAADLYDEKSYASAKIAYEKLLAQCAEISAIPLARLAAIYARHSAQSAIESVPGFGRLDRPSGQWKQVAADARQAKAAFDSKDFAKARDLWTQAAVEIGKRHKGPARDVNKHQGFVLAWFVSGPYAGKPGPALFDVAFGPEKNDKSVAWRPLLFDRPDHYAVDLNAAISTADNCLVYVRTRVHSPVAQGARLELGSDDAVKVWLNGKKIHGKNKARGMRPGEDIVRVKLSAGWNDLMLKVIDHAGDWGFCCRIRKPNGKPLNGLKIEAK
jgi:hypothetical protein